MSYRFIQGTDTAESCLRAEQFMTRLLLQRIGDFNNGRLEEVTTSKIAAFAAVTNGSP
ncbi:hypothetical protein D3C86_1835790 [compost metagenome]